ncbi:hypothetical protein L798_04201 [Zootermopsis nevadensis]|uniref:Uncharacterized protein n=1 Tax=Zootermopsis nevadensis TaxID=136037 RepID=A0A067RNF8_ZOONE|nr:hypothetical protein L798_04201 [Zootermopsis nevadensis]
MVGCGRDGHHHHHHSCNAAHNTASELAEYGQVCSPLEKAQQSNHRMDPAKVGPLPQPALLEFDLSSQNPTLYDNRYSHSHLVRKWGARGLRNQFPIAQYHYHFHYQSHYHLASQVL